MYRIPRYQYGTDPALEPDPEDEILRILGPQPEATPYEVQEYQPSGFDQFLENFAPPDMPAPRTFLEGLIAGASRGLGTRGMAARKKRAVFEQKQQELAKTRDAENRKATEDYRQRELELRERLATEKRSEDRKQEEYFRDNPIADSNFIADNPWAAPYKGQRLRQGFVDRMQASNAPESPKERAARERAEATQNRQIAAQERQTRLGMATTLGQFRDDYRADPDIAAERTASQNLKTIQDAKKLGTGPGDLAMLIAYVRATEPGIMSVVRQEELGNLQSALGEFRRYMNIPSKWFSGQLMNDTGRNEIEAAAKTIAQARKGDADAARKQFEQQIRLTLPEVDPGLILRERDLGFDPARTPGGGPPAVPASWTPVP